MDLNEDSLNMQKVLIFTPAYLPGYKAGGPIRTLSNVVAHLNSKYDFYIVTNDRDLGDEVAYEGKPINKWTHHDNTKVFYASSDYKRFYFLYKLIKSVNPQVLYLNGYFSFFFSIYIIFLRYVGLCGGARIVIAPRGEFSKGALSLKAVKKNIFLKLALFFKCYDGVRWQASSIYEEQDIKRIFTDGVVYIAPNLSVTAKEELLYAPKKHKESGVLRVVFVGRIAKMKNLYFTLVVLKQVNASISFDIYGPLEDKMYWQECLNLIDTLPINIKVKYCGLVLPYNVQDVILSYDLFFLPSHGENFGQVIAEAVSVGTPVLLSDMTPWRNLHSIGIGWDIPMGDQQGFISAIEYCALLGETDYHEWRVSIVNWAICNLCSREVIKSNMDLFKL